MSEQLSDDGMPRWSANVEGEPDDTEPMPERQAELRQSYTANIASGKAPYEGVAILTRGEVRWIMRERNWSGEREVGDKERANFSGANLIRANLIGAHLRAANLSSADLFGADLSGADLANSNLSGTTLQAAYMNIYTKVQFATIDSKTRLVDVRWNGAPVSRLNWADVATFGDEYVARQPKNGAGKKNKATRLYEYTVAVLTYRQVSTLLRDQGLNEDADRFAYRAKFIQRQVLRRQGSLGRAFGSWLLDAVSGYGYRPMRSVVTYLLVVGLFAVAYFALGGAHSQSLTWNEALVVSLTAFHGRGFFATAFQPGDPQAALAAIEAVIGLLIEIVFIATFTQRFFAR